MCFYITLTAYDMLATETAVKTPDAIAQGLVFF